MTTKEEKLLLFFDKCCKYCNLRAKKMIIFDFRGRFQLSSWKWRTISDTPSPGAASPNTPVYDCSPRRKRGKSPSFLEKSPFLWYSMCGTFPQFIRKVINHEFRRKSPGCR